MKHAAKQQKCVRLESFSQDPIGFEAGDANLYRYVGNQPTALVDPSGLDDVYGIAGDEYEELKEFREKNPNHPWADAMDTVLGIHNGTIDTPHLPRSPSIFDQFHWGGGINECEAQDWFTQRYPGWIAAAKRMAKDRIENLINSSLRMRFGLDETPLDGPVARVRPKYDKANDYGQIFLPGMFGPGPGEDTNECKYGDRPQTPRRANADGPGGFWFEVADFEIEWTGKSYRWKANLLIRDALGSSPQDAKEEGEVSASESKWLADQFGARQDELITHAKYPISGSGVVD